MIMRHPPPHTHTPLYHVIYLFFLGGGPYSTNAVCRCLSAGCIAQNEGLDKELSEEDEAKQKVLVKKEGEEMLIWREACYTALERHADDAAVQVTHDMF